MTAILLALAGVSLLVGRTRTQFRLADRAPRSSRPVRRVPRVWGVVCAIVAALVCGGIAAMIAAMLVAAVFVWRARRIAGAARAGRQRDELIRALSLMIAELSVGAPSSRACAVAAQELSGGHVGVTDLSEVAMVLRALASRVELGGPIVVEVGAIDDPDTSWQHIVRAWRVSESLGLPLADLLDSVRTDLRARQAFSERTRAGLAGPRATATVLAGLPIMGVLLGQATGARPMQILLGGGLGGALLVIGTGLVGAGLVWSERITDKVVRP